MGVFREDITLIADDPYEDQLLRRYASVREAGHQVTDLAELMGYAHPGGDQEYRAVRMEAFSTCSHVIGISIERLLGGNRKHAIRTLNESQGRKSP